MRTLRLTVLALAVLPSFAGCAAVIGIEEAKLDPRLDRGGSGNGGNGGGNAGTGGNAGGGATLCDTYCDTVGETCTDQFAQYESRAVCMKVCSRLDPGQPGDDVGNTVNCRLHYAESAATAGELASNCSAAGPGGSNADVPTGICGTYCEGLCRIAFDSCRGAQVIFSSVSECVAACRTIPDLGNYNANIQDGNSVQCRLYHVSAAQIDPVIHCPHVTGTVGPCRVLP
jgi:hypothetical protein